MTLKKSSLGDSHRRKFDQLSVNGKGLSVLNPFDRDEYGGSSVVGALRRGDGSRRTPCSAAERSIGTRGAWETGMQIVVCASWLLMTWLHVATSRA